MGIVVLRGISASLLVTVITLLTGMFWNAMGLGGISVSTLVDIGLLLSCLIGGYRTGRESRLWFLGGIAGAGFVGVGALLLALFVPLRADGVLQIMLEGTILGLIAGAVGAGRSKGYGRPVVSRLGRRANSWKAEEEEGMGWDEAESGSWGEIAEEEGENDRGLDEDAVQTINSPAAERSGSHESNSAWTRRAQPEGGRGVEENDEEAEAGMEAWRPDSERKKRWKLGSGRQERWSGELWGSGEQSQFVDRESVAHNGRQVVSYPRSSPWWDEDVGQRK